MPLFVGQGRCLRARAGSKPHQQQARTANCFGTSMVQPRARSRPNRADRQASAHHDHPRVMF